MCVAGICDACTKLAPTLMLFRRQEDRKVVAIALSVTMLDFIVYFALDNVGMFVGYWLLGIIPKGLIAPWNHHHQHCMTFRSAVLNRLLELSYSLHTGMTSNLWVLHHNLGHHVNYLEQSKDESRWRRNSGKTMGVVEYSLSVTLTDNYRAFLVGKRYPKHQRVFVAFAALTWAFVAALGIYKPWAGLFIFALPMVCTIMYTSWVTYDHHAGLDPDDPMKASFNIMNRWFNRLTGNLGYHTAHHYKPGLHWSKLPELHETIKDRIPAELFVKSTFDAFLPDDKSVEVPINIMPEPLDNIEADDAIQLDQAS
ncbi:MAG: fatty acid desaturase [Myxococcales bacterium]|nr:fatty acid desaturase [Myxococcales bacterium]